MSSTAGLEDKPWDATTAACARLLGIEQLVLLQLQGRMWRIRARGRPSYTVISASATTGRPTKVGYAPPGEEPWGQSRCDAAYAVIGPHLGQVEVRAGREPEGEEHEATGTACEIIRRRDRRPVSR